MILLILQASCKKLNATSFLDTICVDSFAKGSATTAYHSGLESVFKNPAGITTLETPTITSSYSSFFDNIYHTVGIGYGTKIAPNIYTAINIPSKLISDIPETVDNGGQALQVGNYSDIETAAISSVGYKLTPDFHLGLNLAYYYQKISNVSGKGLGVDAGFIYTYNAFSIGAAVQNLGNTNIQWSSGTNDQKKQRINLGIQYKPIYGITLLADAQCDQNNSNIYSFGAEYKLIENFSVSGGIYDIQNPQWSMGTNLSFGKTTIQYALSQNQYLGGIQKLCLNVSL